MDIYSKYLIECNRVIDFSDKKLSEFSFVNAPLNLEILLLNRNNLTKFSFDGCETLLDLQEIYLSNNYLTEFSFKECPQSLQKININDNQLEYFSFANAPQNLKYISLENNLFKEISFKGCPSNLQKIVLYCNNNLSKIDWCGAPPNLKIKPEKFQKEFDEYKNSLEFYKEMSIKYRPITDAILHFYMQPPNSKV